MVITGGWKDNKVDRALALPEAYINSIPASHLVP